MCAGALGSVIFCLLAATAGAVTLNFGGYSGTLPYTENGFNISATQAPVGGSWSGGPGVVGAFSPQNLSLGSQVGTLKVMLIGGGLFFFNSVDLTGTANEQFNYSITGFLSGTSQFADNGYLDTYEIGNPYNSISGNPAQLIDVLFISIYSNPQVNTSFSVANLNVSAVPDSSSTLALLGLSSAALLVLGLKQRFAGKV